MRENMQTRSYAVELETREEGEGFLISGYFAVFGKETELFPGGFEEIKSGAFANTLGDDVRALVNHDTTLVLGRTRAGTLFLREDEKGLWGEIRINPKDTDAVNLYRRVQRGDVSQCSFGFDIIREDSEYRKDGTTKWMVEEVRLFEVSVCTFPAYKETGVEARKEQASARRLREARKNELKARLEDVKTGSNCTENPQ